MQLIDLCKLQKSPTYLEIYNYAYECNKLFYLV